ncbi:hypothetical protein C4K26_4374 [Pseudomonas chlororaphis]|nr:hypothetical protein C4K26_4374 [Pseudomonas chlororaphis]
MIEDATSGSNVEPLNHSDFTLLKMIPSFFNLFWLPVYFL